MSVADENLNYAELCFEFASNPKSSTEHREMFVEMTKKWMQIADELIGAADRLNRQAGRNRRASLGGLAACFL